MNKKFDLFIVIAALLIGLWLGVCIKGYLDSNIMQVGSNAATAEDIYQTCLDSIPDNSVIKTYGEYEMSVNDYYNMVENCNKIYKELK